MKRLILAGILFLPAGLGAGEERTAAADRPDPVERRVANMTERLDLNEEQQEQVRQLLRAEAERRENFRARMQAAETPEERRALAQTMGADRPNLREEIFAILTEEQRQQMREQIRESRQERREMRRKEEEQSRETRAERREARPEGRPQQARERDSGERRGRGPENRPERPSPARE